MNKKRILVFLGTLLVIFTCKCINVLAEIDEVELNETFYDGFEIVKNDDGENTCTITKYIGTIYTNIIPDELNGYKVTRIGESAFEGAKQVTGEVTLPDSIKYIGKNAFKNCSMLTGIKLGKGLIEIDDYAFSNCSSLKYVTFNKIEKIGTGVFEECKAFTQKNIVIPDTLKSMGSNVFSNSNIESVKFTSDKAPQIESDTFSNYEGKIIIPENFEDYIGSEWAGSEVDGIQTLLGDLDKNGIVDANDAAIVLDIYKYNTVTRENLMIADMDRNGIIDANDAASILDKYKYGK